MEQNMTLFNQPSSEFDAIWKAVIELKDSHHKVRKRLFAEVSNLKKEVVGLKVENERMKFHTESKQLIRWTA